MAFDSELILSDTADQTVIKVIVRLIFLNR